MSRWTFILFPFALVACAESPPPTDLRASGHVEATEVRLAPDAGGRVLAITVNEGDAVQVGEVILRLDPRDAELAVARAKADQQLADAQLRLALAGARREEISQADAQAEAARQDIAAARAELGAADADLERFEALLKANAGSRKQREDAASRRDVARERVQAAESRARAADQVTARLRAGARPQEIEAARARVAAAAALRASADKVLADTTLHSPIGGIVTAKLVEAGEVLAPRSPAVVISDLANAWADVFVPEPAVPRLRLGQSATLFTDAGGSGLPGTIRYISPKAEFTPRNVQTAEERSKLVYRIRVAVDNREGILKQGMPVDAVISLQPLP
ncbi:MAG: HlyD family secretion protein [Acidobacteriota bacterium]